MEFIKNLIVKAERFLKTDMNYLLSGGFWLSAGRLVAGLAGFIATIVLTKLLPKEAYGTYKFILSAYAIVAGFSLSGMFTAVTQSVSQGFDGTMQKGFKSMLSFSWIPVCLACLASIYYYLNDNTVLAISLLVIAIALPLNESGQTYNAFLVGKKKFKQSTVYGVWLATIPQLAAIVFALVFKNVVCITSAFLISSMAVTMILYKMTAKFYVENNNTNEKAITFGKHLSLMGVIGSISFQLDKMLVFHFLGAPILAAYSIAQSVPQQIRYLSKVLSTLAFVKFSNNSVENLKKTLNRKALILFLICLVIVIAYILIAPFAFKILFPAYPEAVLMSQVFSLVILFFPSTLYQQALTAQLKQKQIYIIQTVSPLVKIGLLFVLLPLYGVWGAFASILAMETVRLIMVAVMFERMRS